MDHGAELAPDYWADARHEGRTRTAMVRLLYEYVGDPAKPVLDVGTGTGALLSAMRRLQSWRLYGADLSPAMLQRVPAPATWAGRLVAADASRLPFSHASFALVTTLSAWHLIPDKQAAMTEFARVAAPNGGFVAIIDATPDDLKRQVIHQLFPEFHEHERLRHSTESQIRQLAETSGLSLVATESFPFTVKFASSNALRHFVAQRPFFGMRAMDDELFESGQARFARRVSDTMPSGPVLSRSALTLSLFRAGG